MWSTSVFPSLFCHMKYVPIKFEGFSCSWVSLIGRPLHPLVQHKPLHNLSNISTQAASPRAQRKTRSQAGYYHFFQRASREKQSTLLHFQSTGKIRLQHLFFCIFFTKHGSLRFDGITNLFHSRSKRANKPTHDHRRVRPSRRRERECGDGLLPRRAR